MASGHGTVYIGLLLVINNISKIILQWNNYNSSTGVIRGANATGNITWTFPISFNTNPVVFGISNNSNFLINYNAINATSAELTVKNTANSQQTATWLKYFAIGY